MEVPAERYVLADQEVDEIIGSYILVVLACIADGSTIDKTVLMEKIHRIHNLLECTLASSEVSCFLVSLDTHGKNDVLASSHIIAELLIYQSSVCENHECAVIVFGSKTDNIFLADHRLAACHDVSLDTDFLALLNKAVHFLKSEA